MKEAAEKKKGKSMDGFPPQKCGGLIEGVQSPTLTEDEWIVSPAEMRGPH